jgi:hypothetical protein
MPPNTMPLRRLQSKWGIQSRRRFWMIMLVFALTGASILFVKDPVFAALRITPETTLWIKLPVALLLYQVLLLLIGSLLGEFHFFWAKCRRLGRLFSRRPHPPANDAATRAP